MKRLSMILLLLAPAFAQSIMSVNSCERSNQASGAQARDARRTPVRLTTCVVAADTQFLPAFAPTLAMSNSESTGTPLSRPIDAIPDGSSQQTSKPTFPSTTYSTPCESYGVMHVGGGCSYYWGGGDIGAQWTAAYGALPESGGEIITNSQLGGYSFSTPFSASTPGKLVVLDLGGNIINFIPTTATAAITLNYGPSIGASYNVGHGVRNGELTNNGCTLGNTCVGSLAVGVSLGTSPALAPSFENLAIGGFSVGLQTQGGIANMWGAVGHNIILSSNAVGLQCNGLYESLQIFGLKAINNGIGIINAGGCDLYIHGGSLDANTLDISNAGHTIIDGMHLETIVGGVGHKVTSSVGTVRIANSTLLDGNKTGTVDQWITCQDGSIDLSNDVFYSDGRTATDVVVATAPCNVLGSYENDSPVALPHFFSGNGYNNLSLALDRNTASQVTSTKLAAGDVFVYSGNPDFAGPWGITGISAGNNGPSNGFYVRFGSSGPVLQGDNGGGHLYAESAPGGTVWTDTASTGLTVDGTLTLKSSTVACDATHRGTFNYVAGGSGEKDTVQVCAKDASDRYAWRTIY